jgi:hypothetical protein
MYDDIKKEDKELRNLHSRLRDLEIEDPMSKNDSDFKEPLLGSYKGKRK